MKTTLFAVSYRWRAAAIVAAAALALAGAPSAAQSGRATIVSASTDQIGAEAYRIAFDALPAAGAVRIYASASADRADSQAPVLTTRTSPVDVTVPGRAGRVYFHLKPESGPARVVSIRRLPLEGANNFRDLGGYRAGDGRFVKWGVLYRTDHLTGLTSKDYDYVGRLGIRLVCDLRTPGERQRAPTRWQGTPPEFQSMPIMNDEALAAVMKPVPADEFKRRLEMVSSWPQQSTSLYSQFVVEYASSYRSVLQRLVAGDLPAVTHCTGGQDRTGVYSALLLTALGVPWDTVVQDYVLTTKYRLTDAVIEQRRREWKKEYGVDVTPAQVRAMQGLRAETLEATFETIDRKYGSFDAFRRDTLKISDDQLAGLRNRLLEP